MSQVLALKISTTALTDYHYGSGSERLAALSSGTRTWYGSDRQGSARQIVRDVGAVLSNRHDGPFGMPVGQGAAAEFVINRREW